ncbi:MAG: AbrB/MazE/SpoVT family DNA-binding domain-containing protein [Nanoarchaeota archaeon]
MYQTKMTKKGQITIPVEYRKKLGLNTSSVVALELEGDKILLEKPKDLLDLCGAWKDMPESRIKEMRARWKTIYDKTPP